MEDPALEVDRHNLALRGLARINRWSGSVRIVWPAIRDLIMKLDRPVRVLDVACGGGDVAIGIWHRAQQIGKQLYVAGCDRSEDALAYARQRATLENADVNFFPLNILTTPLPEDYDVVMTSLFLHHLADPEAIDFLHGAKQAARKMVLIYDLLRHRRGLILAYIGTHLLSSSDIVHVDGPLSVRAAYTLDEVRKLAGAAGLNGATVNRRWPCRFLLSWTKS